VQGLPSICDHSGRPKPALPGRRTPRSLCTEAETRRVLKSNLSGCAAVIMKQNATRGWVLYDDSCGFCRWWIPLWANTLSGRGFEIAPLQSAWVVERLGLSPNELLADLRLLLADGQLVVGADVYRHVMQRIWWAYPVYLLSIAPLLSQVFDWGYRTFATHRYRISRVCRLRTGN
jgi:predicted DCC family thiol-disulfide oxidoreductase YuxK